MDGLWDVQLPMQHDTPTTASPSSPKISYIITKEKSRSDLVQYLLAIAFSPVISTLKTAVDNGNFVTWPGINELNFNKLLSTTIPIEKEHMDQEQKNLRSTPTEEHEDFPPALTTKKKYELFATVEKTDFLSTAAKNKAYPNQTGKFSYKSARGNEYMFIL